MRNQDTLLEHLKETRIIAILRGIPKETALHVARALSRGGIVFAEITMNTEGALDIISQWRVTPDLNMIIGAGTVLDLDMAKEAVRAGAQYLVSPNVDEAVIQYACEQGIGVFPGAMTPTEIVRAWKAGANAVKLFPMASMGIEYLKEIRAPLDQIPLIVTGGVRIDNIQEFLSAGTTAVGLGSSLANSELIREGRYDLIEQNAATMIQAVTTFNSNRNQV